MKPLIRRARARQLRIHAFVSLLIAALAVPAAADDVDPAALELEEAQDLAVTAQPLLDARSQAVRSARAAAIAAKQLPDPMLVGGLTDLTVTGPDRYTLENESDTQF